jgi:outer membrane protein, multidrug efflux system
MSKFIVYSCSVAKVPLMQMIKPVGTAQVHTKSLTCAGQPGSLSNRMYSKARAAILVGVLCCLLAGSSWAEPSQPVELEITLEQAISRALSSHPNLNVSKSKIRQAEIAAAHSDAWPSASVGIGAWGGSGDALINSNYTSQNSLDTYVFFQQQLRPPGQNAARRQVAQREIESAEASSRLAELQLAQQVKDAFFSRRMADEQVRLAKENLTLAEQLVELTRLRFEAGAGPKLDLTVAIIQKSRADQELAGALGQLILSQQKLAPLLGLPSNERIVCQAELMPKSVKEVWEILSEMGDSHPRLQMARASLLASQSQRELAETQGGPTPGVQAIYDVVRPSYSVQLTLSFPIDWGGLGSEIDQKAEIENERKSALAAETLQLQTEIRTSFQSYQLAMQQAANYQENILKPTEEVLRVNQYGYQRGAIPYLQVLTVQQQLSTVRKEYVQRLHEAHQALNALEYAVGRAL